MSNLHYTVFKDVRDSLKTLIGQSLDPYQTMPGGNYTEPDRGAGIVTDVVNENIIDDSPGNLDDLGENRVSVFLYQIQPNPYLRNQTSTAYDESSGSYKLSKHDIALDLYYMITAFSASRENEAGILERIVHVLNGDAVIKGELLKGSLPANGNQEIKVQPISHNLDELNKIWSIFPNKVYRLSLFYTLSPVLIKSAKIEPRVAPITRVGGLES